MKDHFDLIIGLGDGSSELAIVISEALGANTNLQIRTEDNESENLLLIPPDLSPFQYEQKFDEIFPVFPTFDDVKTLFILNANADEAGLSLRFLERLSMQISRENLSILLLRSEMQNLLSSAERSQEEHISAALQEHARAGHFKEIILVDLDELLKLSANLEIENYHQVLNENLAHLLLMKYKFEKEKPLFGGLTQRVAAANITTVGILGEGGNELLLRDLKLPREKNFCYYVPRRKIREEGHNLVLKIKGEIARRKEKDEEKIVFGIFESNFDTDDISCYLIYRTSANQNLIKLIEESDKELELTGIKETF